MYTVLDVTVVLNKYENLRVCVVKGKKYSGTSVHEFNSFLEDVRHPKFS
jgi:hypothetical protein